MPSAVPDPSSATSPVKICKCPPADRISIVSCTAGPGVPLETPPLGVVRVTFELRTSEVRAAFEQRSGGVLAAFWGRSGDVRAADGYDRADGSR